MQKLITSLNSSRQSASFDMLQEYIRRFLKNDLFWPLTSISDLMSRFFEGETFWFSLRGTYQSNYILKQIWSQIRWRQRPFFRRPHFNKIQRIKKEKGGYRWHLKGCKKIGKPDFFAYPPDSGIWNIYEWKYIVKKTLYSISTLCGKSHRLVVTIPPSRFFQFCSKTQNFCFSWFRLI